MNKITQRLQSLEKKVLPEIQKAEREREEHLDYFRAFRLNDKFLQTLADSLPPTAFSPSLSEDEKTRLQLRAARCAAEVAYELENASPDEIESKINDLFSAHDVAERYRKYLWFYGVEISEEQAREDLKEFDSLVGTADPKEAVQILKAKGII